MKRLLRNGPLLLIVALAVRVNLTNPSTWYAGFMTALAVMMVAIPLLDRWLGSSKYYRRWYLMCRNGLEEITNTPPGLEKKVAHRVLKEIGPRTSPREPWENPYG